MLKVKREGDRFGDGVAQGPQPVKAGRLRAASRCYNDVVIVFAIDCEARVVRQRGDGVNRLLEADVDPRPARLLHQAIDDGLRGVGLGKHSAVFLGLEGHAPRGEPIHGVFGVKLSKGPFELLAPAGVVFGQRGGGEAGVGDIAPPSAGYLDLGEQLVGFLEQYHLGMGMVLGGREGRKEACRPTTNHRQKLSSFHLGSVKFRYFRIAIGGLW